MARSSVHHIDGNAVPDQRKIMEMALIGGHTQGDALSSVLYDPTVVSTITDHTGAHPAWYLFSAAAAGATVVLRHRRSAE